MSGIKSIHFGETTSTAETNFEKILLNLETVAKGMYDMGGKQTEKACKTTITIGMYNCTITVKDKMKNMEEVLCVYDVVITDNNQVQVYSGHIVMFRNYTLW